LTALDPGRAVDDEALVVLVGGGQEQIDPRLPVAESPAIPEFMVDERAIKSDPSHTVRGHRSVPFSSRTTSASIQRLRAADHGQSCASSARSISPRAWRATTRGGVWVIAVRWRGR